MSSACDNDFFHKIVTSFVKIGSFQNQESRLLLVLFKFHSAKDLCLKQTLSMENIIHF